MPELTDAANIELESATNELLSVDRTDKAAANRWTKYGYDRLYVEGPAKFEKNSTYVNLATGDLEDAPSRKHSAEVTIEGETATVEIHKDGKGHIYTLTLSVEGEDFEPAEDDEGDDNEDEHEVVADGGEDVTDHVDDETIEDAIEDQAGPVDNPDTPTVDEVRDALAWVQQSVTEFWGEWLDNLERGECEVVHEDGEVIVFATGEQSVPRRDLRDYYDGELHERMPDIVNAVHHAEARSRCDYDWGYVYPLVVRKPESFDAGQGYVEALVNSLQGRGLSPGQAWAYYGVEIRGYSRNQWGKRKGDADHKNVSDALEKAKRKLP